MTIEVHGRHHLSQPTYRPTLADWQAFSCLSVPGWLFLLSTQDLVWYGQSIRFNSFGADYARHRRTLSIIGREMILEHANLTVRDLERSIEFYCSLLGGSVRWRGRNSADRPAAHVGTEHSYLALFQASEVSKTDPLPTLDTSVPGFNHLGFVVDDMDSVVSRLRLLGIEPTTDDTYDPGRHVYFIDPDGIEIELVQY